VYKQDYGAIFYLVGIIKKNCMCILNKKSEIKYNERILNMSLFNCHYYS